MIFFSCCPAVIFGFKAIRMVQGMRSIQAFQIVIQVHRIVAILADIVERSTVQRHRGNTALIWRCPLAIVSLFGAPDFGSRGWPPVGNVCSVFGGNAQTRHFVPRIISSEPEPFTVPFSFKELNLVGVSRIVDIHDRRSVTGNHCVRICCVCLLSIQTKAIITSAYPGQINLVSSCPGFNAVLVVGIIAVICILPPVNDCIFSVTVRFPYCIERSVF